MKQNLNICSRFILGLLLSLTLLCVPAMAQLGWVLQGSTTQQNIWAISFIGNSNSGYCVGYNGTLLKTSNGGTYWIAQSTGTNNWLQCIHFPDPNTGYAAGTGGVLVKTTNSGMNWQLYPAGTNERQTSIFFVDTQTGFAATASGGIVKTTNGGMNWTYVQLINAYFSSIRFVNNTTGYVCGTFGSDGHIYKTTDSGNNWNNIDISPHGYGCVFFLNTSTGYFVGNSGKIVKTTNGGDNWIVQSSNTTKFLTSVYFTNENTGYAVGQDGIILKTTNGRNVWSVQQNLATSYILRSVWFINSLVGYAAGDYGTIIKTTTGGNPLGIDPKGPITPESFALYQNYPNPFNPVTKIRFDIPAAPLSFGEGPGVRLAIYDVLGREVAVLVNEQLKPGTYEVEWDGTDYPSGVYFYKLITADFTDTKRMVLVK